MNGFHLLDLLQIKQSNNNYNNKTVHTLLDLMTLVKCAAVSANKDST